MEQIYTSHEIGDFMTKMILESYSNNIIIGKMCSIPHVTAQEYLLTQGYILENGSSILINTQSYRSKPCNAERSVLTINHTQEGVHEAER